jgi:hypothetical protein
MKLEDLFTTEWTPQVKEYADKMVQGVRHIDELIEYEQPEDTLFKTQTHEDIFHDLVCEAATENLINYGDPKLDAETFDDITIKVDIYESLLRLRQDGVIDWIDDENGEEIIFKKNEG